jgi:hypothetical protein
MFSATPSSQGPGHHRRQLSTPAYPEAATFTRPVMAGNQPHRAHRRGQTVDYGYAPQVSAGRRPAPKTVPELRDYFNEKSGYSRQTKPAQQAPAYVPNTAAFYSGYVAHGGRVSSISAAMDMEPRGPSRTLPSFGSHLFPGTIHCAGPFKVSQRMLRQSITIEICPAPYAPGAAAQPFNGPASANGYL